MYSGEAGQPAQFIETLLLLVFSMFFPRDFAKRCKLRLLPVLLVAVLLAGAAHAQSRGGPFSQSPRSVRSRTVDQQHVRLEFNFDWDQQEIQAKAVHTLELLS